MVALLNTTDYQETGSLALQLKTKAHDPGTADLAVPKSRMGPKRPPIGIAANERERLF